ncbi:hypothetical protein, partial [Actinomadura bangladeshensis]|uniref:hypothetical protein n=1 Tax=Actinomadura bangladeshensis TaxID=453573 RepID=UPI001A9CDE64
HTIIGAEIGNTQRHARKIPVSPYLRHRRLVRPHVSPESDREGNLVNSWQTTLDNYNNGIIGPGHCG